MNPNSSASHEAATLKLIDTILTDPMLLRKLSDRVYQLIREEAYLQRDRDKTSCWSGSDGDVY